MCNEWFVGLGKLKTKMLRFVASVQATIHLYMGLFISFDNDRNVVFYSKFYN